MFAIQENNKENQLYTACGVRKSNPSGFTRARRLKAEKEKKDKHNKQLHADAKWLLDIRDWEYSERPSKTEG